VMTNDEFSKILDVERGEAVLFQHLQRRRLAHTGVGLGVARDAALADAGALADPLIRGVEDLGELVIRHDALRHVAPRADQLGEGALHAGTSPRANSAPMFWLR